MPVTLYADQRETESLNFVKQILKKSNLSAASTLLEVGCGEGEHARVLAEEGYDVTGIDSSAESIAAAKNYEKDRLHFFVHDIRLPFHINYFDAALNLFSAFGYFRTEREHYNAIRTIANSIKHEGWLMLDYLNVHYTEDHLSEKEEKKVDGVPFEITAWSDENYFYKKFTGADNKEHLEKRAKLSLGDFNDMFAFHGLQVQEVYGDYSLNTYDVKRSPRLILVARKK